MATDRREGVEREGGRGGGLIFVLIEHFYHSVSVFACKCPLTLCLLSCFVCCRFKCAAAFLYSRGSYRCSAMELQMDSCFNEHTFFTFIVFRWTFGIKTMTTTRCCCV